MWDKHQSFPPHCQQLGLASLLLARAGLGPLGGFPVHGKMSDQALVWLLLLAGLRQPKGGGGWGCTLPADRPRQHQHLGQEMAEMEKELGLRNHLAWVGISALLLSSCEILCKSRKTWPSLSVSSSLKRCTF